MEYSNLDRDGLLSKIKELENKLEISNGNKASGTWQFYENIIEGVQDGIWITNENDIIFFSNAGMERIAGIPREEINGCNFFTDFPKETVGELFPYYNQARNDRKPIWYDIKVDTPAGRSTWQNGWLIPQFEGESFKGIICTARDVTLHKLAEHDLLESEAKYKNLVETASDAIYMMSEDGKIIDTNHSACVMLGKVKEEIIGSMIDSVDPNFPLDDFLNFWKKIAFNKQAIFETSHLRKDGSLIPIEISGKKFKLNGKVFYYGIARDITERKMVEKKLVENEKQLRKNYEVFFNSISDFLFVLDEQGNIIHTNSTVTDRLGYTQEELTGLSVLMVHPPEWREEAGCIVSEMLSGVSAYCTIPIVTKSGVEIPVETRVTHGLWNGKPVIFGVTKDISKIKLSEEKFSKVFYLNPSACGLSDLVTGEYIEVKDQFCKLLGFDKNEVIGKTAIDLGIVSQEAVNEVLLHAQRNGSLSNIRANLKTKNGDIKHVLLSADNIYVQDEKYRYTIVHDITELVWAEETLRESEERFKSLHNASFGGIAIHDEGVILECNLGLSEMTGYSKDELIGMDGLLLIAEKSRSYVMSNIQSGHEKSYEAFGLRKNGDEFPMQLEARNVHYKGKQVRTVEFRDITDLKLAEKALRESEKKFKSIFENKGTATGLYGDDGVILDCNNQFVEMSGFEKDDIIGKAKWSDFVLKEDLERLQNYNAARTNKDNPPPAHYECSIKNKQGDILNVIVNISLMGSVRIVTLTDISELKKIEYALKESEIKYRKYVENAPLGIFVVDGNGKYIEVNQEACKLLGYTKDELLQLSIPDVAIAEAGLSNFNKLTEGGELHYESGLRRKDGSIVYVRLDAVAIGNDQFMGFCANIEERIQYEIDLLESKEKAEESEEKYRLLHENSGLGIGYYSPEGIVLSFNSTASKYMNGVPADFEGKSVFELYPKQDAELYYERLQKSKNSDEVIFYEDFIQLPNQEMWFLSTYTKIVNSKNEVLGIQIISQNISEQKQSELEIKKLNEELENRVLDRTQQLETINKELEAFTYSVSHDLKAPLRAIIGFSQMLAEDYSGLLDSEGKRYISVIKNNANNMANLIRDLLDLSRTGRIQIRRKRVDLASICKRITGELLDGLNDREISFKIGSLQVVNADETLIYQLLLNLLSNAVKFTSQNGKTEIEIGSFSQEERTVFYVKDNGIGFDMRYADKVFEVFQRLHDNEEFSGTGIGLSIVQRIIAKHNGKIWVESEKGKGTTFFFTLG